MDYRSRAKRQHKQRNYNYRFEKSVLGHLRRIGIVFSASLPKTGLLYLLKPLHRSKGFVFSFPPLSTLSAPLGGVEKERGISRRD